jgi:hypothetical protein
MLWVTDLQVSPYGLALSRVCTTSVRARFHDRSVRVPWRSIPLDDFSTTGDTVKTSGTMARALGHFELLSTVEEAG